MTVNDTNDADEAGKIGEATIERDYRRLLASMEAERERMRQSRAGLDDERQKMKNECDKMREETEKWCFQERQNIENGWEELREIQKQVEVISAGAEEKMEIDCSGTVFHIKKSTLVSVKGSLLNSMFSNEFIHKIPKNNKGQYVLDFNPICFGLIVDWLKNRAVAPQNTASQDKVPLPPVPPEQKANMDVLCDTLRLHQFTPQNQLTTIHQTSLLVQPLSVKASHDGWQVITSQYPLRLSAPSYFEITVATNSDPRGGLAIGVMGHIPTGVEVHSLKQNDGILYNSNNGLVQTECCGMAEIVKQVQFKEGSHIGVRFDPSVHLVKWYLNGQAIGSCSFKHDYIDAIRTVFPACALYSKGTHLKVDFQAKPPPVL